MEKHEFLQIREAIQAARTQSSLTGTMTRSAMLNNTGDEVSLVSPSAA